MIQEVTTDALRRMDNTEGLILQGCGGFFGFSQCTLDIGKVYLSHARVLLF